MVWSAALRQNYEIKVYYMSQSTPQDDEDEFDFWTVDGDFGESPQPLRDPFFCNACSEAEAEGGERLVEFESEEDTVDKMARERFTILQV